MQIVKRSFRKIMLARGGGLYAFGFLITFVGLEVSMFFSEVFAAESVGGFFGEQLLELLLRFSVLSFQNMIYAFVWPVYIIQISPAWGALAIGAMYLLFDRYLKSRVQHWLIGDELQMDEPVE